MHFERTNRACRLDLVSKSHFVLAEIALVRLSRPGVAPEEVAPSGSYFTFLSVAVFHSLIGPIFCYS